MKKIILLICACLLCTGCAFIGDNSTKIVVASDLHYLSSELYDVDTLKQYVPNEDGQAFEYIEEIIDSFIDEMLKVKPDMVVITGDIADEGEKLSHEMMASKLQKLVDKGIKVAVMPGNHDLNNKGARGFKDGDIFVTESIDKNEFVSIYENMGYGSAKSRDEDSLSYVAEVNEKTWVMIIDVNASQNKEEISPSTMEWIEDNLKYAKEHDIKVFTCTHQNILDHNLNSESYKLKDNDDELFYLLCEYGVKVNFSGHSHYQHYKSVNELKEITSSALSAYPCQYGLVKISDKGIDYNTVSLNLKHSKEIKQYLLDNIQVLNGTRLFEEDLSTYYCDIIYNFRTGSFDKIKVDDELLSRIETANMSIYMEVMSIIEEAGSNFNSIVIE